MKEAAGEANLTVVAIILIAVVVAIATPLVGNLMKNASKRSCCTDAGGVWKNQKCQNSSTNQFNATNYNTCINDTKAS